MHYATADERTRELLDQRKELAARFRETYGAEDIPSASPYFVGVFDTVAAIANPSSKYSLAAAVALLLLAISAVLAFWSLSFLQWLAVLGGVVAIIALTVYLSTHVKWETRLEPTLPGYLGGLVALCFLTMRRVTRGLNRFGLQGIILTSEEAIRKQSPGSQILRLNGW